MNLMTQSQWARRHDVSPQYVGQLVKQGRITLVNGKVDVETADQIMLARCQKKIRTPKKDEEGEGNLSQQFLKSKIKTETERAKILATKAKRDEGSWMHIDDVRRILFDRNREVHGALSHIADRVADQFAASTEAHEIYCCLNREIRNAVEALTRDV